MSNTTALYVQRQGNVELKTEEYLTKERSITFVSFTKFEDMEKIRKNKDNKLMV